MTQFVIADNVNTQLAAAATTSATTLTLASSANLPTLSGGQVMPLTLNDAATGAIYEIVYVTAISGVTLTVTRAQEGTTAQNWNIGDYAYVAPTSGTVATSLGNPSNQFAVAQATSSNQAPQLGQVQSGAINYAVDTGSANTYAVAYSPAVASITDGLKLRFKAKTANTGASTFSPNGLTAVAIWGAAHSALQGGEIIANSDVELVWNSSLNTTGVWVLLESTGGALQVAPATKSNHAVNLGQFQTAAQYQANQSGSLGNPITSTSYSVATQSITFPSFSKSGAFRVHAELVASGFSQAAAVEAQFQNLLFDGATNVVQGNAWSVYKKNSGYGWSVADTGLSFSTYTPGATVTFLHRVSCGIIEDNQFSLQNCFMRLTVIEA